MRRTAKKASPRTSRVKAVPWAVLLQGVVVVGRRWKALSARDRERLKELLAQSGGRVSRLSDKQRKELRKLAGKLDLKGMSKDLIALRAVRGRRGRRRGA